MLFDLQADGAKLTHAKYDVCVCGTGPAGITVARDLASAGKRVVLLEAGGFEYSQRSQDVYAGTESGINTYNTSVQAGRLRYFGGTSNHWSGMCGVFDESDFWPERYHDLPGWPIARKSILAHLQEAASILDLKSTDFSPQILGNSKNASFEIRLSSMSPPTRFGTKFRDEIVKSKNIDLFINANVVDLHLQQTPGGHPDIDHVLVSNYRKDTAHVTAKRYVLALGSIENARILLNANKQLATGIGNHSGLVGKCFMEHLNVQIGRYVARPGGRLASESLGLGPTEQSIRRLRIGNGILALDHSAKPQEYGRLAPLRGMIRSGVCEFDTVREFARKFKDFSCAGDGAISTMIEQAPDKSNGVSLGSASDEFGIKRPHLHWTLTDVDRRTIRALGFELAKEFVANDLGRVQLNKFIVDATKEIEVWPHAHQMGTTRMSSDPKDGVVDVNCRVHSVANLYIAGSSVFPTGGGINPTFTIVMLSLRLAQHLRQLST